MQGSNDKIKSANLKDSQDSDANARLRDLDIESKVEGKSDIDSPDHQESPPQNEIAEIRGNTRREITASQEKQEQKKLDPKKKKRSAKSSKPVKRKKNRSKLASKVITALLALKKKAMAQAKKSFKKLGNKKPKVKKNSKPSKKRGKERPKKNIKSPKQRQKTHISKTLAPVQNKQENFHTVIDGKQVSGKIITQEVENHPSSEKNLDKNKQKDKPLDSLFKNKSLKQETLSEDIKVEEVSKDDYSFSPENFGNMTPDSVSNALDNDLTKQAAVEK